MSWPNRQTHDMENTTMTTTTTTARMTERQKRAVACPKCGAAAGKPCVSSRVPGAHTLGGGWGGPPSLDRAHPERRAAALLARRPAATEAAAVGAVVVVGGAVVVDVPHAQRGAAIVRPEDDRQLALAEYLGCEPEEVMPLFDLMPELERTPHVAVAAIAATFLTPGGVYAVLVPDEYAMLCARYDYPPSDEAYTVVRMRTIHADDPVVRVWLPLL